MYVTQYRSFEKTYVRSVGCQASGTSDKWNCLISWIVEQVGRQRSCMGLFIHHQIRHTKCDIKDFTRMVDESRTKNIAQNTNYSWKIISMLYIYFHVIYIISQAMKKYYYEDPTFKLWRSPEVLLLNFEGGPGVPLINLRGVLGPTFKLWGDSESQGLEIPGPGVLIPLLHHARNLHVCLSYHGLVILLPQWFRYENNCTFTKFSMLENFVSYLRNNKDDRSKWTF